MKFIKNTILLFFIFFIGSAIIDIYVGNTNISMSLGIVLAIVIILKPQKHFRKLGSVKKIFKTGIPDETVEHHRNLILDQFIAGDLAKHFSTDIFLKKGEKLVFDIPGIQICEEKTIKLKGSHSGYSVRIMKGLSYRFGDFESTAEKRVAALDTGHFIITIASPSPKNIETLISSTNRSIIAEPMKKINNRRKVFLMNFISNILWVLIIGNLLNIRFNSFQ